MFLIQKTIFQYQGSPWSLFHLWLEPLFWREFLIQVALVASMTIGGILAVQIAYPRSMALPQTRIGGQSFAFQSKQQITQTINQLGNERFQVSAGDQSLERTPNELGIQLNANRDADRAVEYSWRERLTPFSLFLEERKADTYSFTIDEAKARLFLESLQAANKRPVDASIKLEGTNVVVTRAENGYVYEPDELLPLLKDIELTENLTIKLAPKVIEPTISDQATEGLVAAINQRITSPLTVEAGGKKLAISGPTLAGWMVIAADEANKTLQLSYSRDKIKETLTLLAGQVYVPATMGSMIMLDGEATGRTEGADGRALAMDASVDAVIAAVTRNEVAARAIIQSVAPASRVTRTYSRSSKGVQALINYWAQTNGGQYGVAIRTADGSISAGYNGGRQFTSASIYKLYVAYVVYSKIDSGEMSLSMNTSTGSNVGTCIEVMIVRSDNPCAEALGNMIGWQGSNGMLAQQGFGSTRLGNNLTTANDTVSWLTQLEGGSLISGSHRSSILSMMSRQIYRAGIPAGSSGSAVSNKVGFLEGLNHDAALVYHPKGTYALVVLSSGSSFSKIADLSRQIAAVMNQ